MLTITRVSAAEMLDMAADGRIAHDTPSGSVVLVLECPHTGDLPLHSLFQVPSPSEFREIIERVAGERGLPPPPDTVRPQLPRMKHMRQVAVRNWWSRHMTCACDRVFWMREGPTSTAHQECVSLN